MEQRTNERIPVNLDGEVISGSMNYIAFIGNISEKGINAIITLLKPDVSSLEEVCDVKLHTPSGETLDLQCRKVWSKAFSPHGLTRNIGMEIINPSLKYKEFLISLQ